MNADIKIISEYNLIDISKGDKSLYFEIEKYYIKEDKFLIYNSHLWGKMTPDEFKELYEAAYNYLKNYKSQQQ